MSIIPISDADAKIDHNYKLQQVVYIMITQPHFICPYILTTQCHNGSVCDYYARGLGQKSPQDFLLILEIFH